MNLEALKKHPYLIGGGVIGAIILWLLLRGGSSQPVSSGNSDLSSIFAAQSQNAQVQAASQAQLNQLTQQQNLAQIQANVANNQLTEQYNEAVLNSDSTNKANKLALQAALAGTAAQVSITANNNATTVATQANELNYAQNLQQMQDAVLMNQINTAAQVQMNSDNNSLSAYETQYQYANNVAVIQGQVASQGITAQQNIAQQELNNQAASSSQVLNLVQQAGLNHGTSSLESTLAQLAAGAMGQTGVAQSIGSTQSANAAASAFTSGAIATAIGNVGSKLVGAFL